jgi:UDP-glucose 4-epimerase
MANTNSTALLTGGAGFLGTHLARSWLEHSAFADSSLVILDDLSGGFAANVPDDPRITFVRGSVTDAALVDDLFGQHQFRFVYHLAAYAAEGLSHFIRRFNYTNNLVGSMTLINASVRHEVECFVFTSSIAVYGSGQVPMTEQTLPRPEDPYGIAKYAVELDL